MTNSQLIQILKTLNKKEFKELEKLVDSPFFNRQRNYSTFLKELKKFHPGFDSRKLTKQYLYLRLYPGREFNNQVMKNLMNGLTRLVEEYLFQIGVKRETAIYYIELSDELRERKIVKGAKRNTKKANVALDESGFDSFFPGKKSRLLKIEESLYQNQNNITKQAYKSWQKTVYFLFSFFSELSYLMGDIRAFASNENFNFETSKLYEFTETKAVSGINNFIKENLPEYSQIVSIYSNLIKLLSRKIDEKTFWETCNLFRNNLKSFNRAGKSYIYTFLQNISISLGAVDRDKYRAETFRLQREMIENDAFTASEELPMNLGKFRNVLIAALDMKEFDWCENFVNDHIIHLSAEHQENMYDFSYAKICFAKKQFEASLEFLSKVKYDMFALKYDVKALTLSIYYELGYYEEAYALIDTFRHFILESKSLSSRRKEVQYNFVRFAAELLKAKGGKKTINLNKLRKDIANTNSVLSKHWLLEKVDEMILLNNKNS